VSDQGAGPGGRPHAPTRVEGGAPTRHEPSAPSPRHGERAGPPATRREAPAATRQERAPAATPGAPLLPAHLAAALTDVAALGTAGGEAQVWTARDTRPDGGPRVLKIYHAHLRPDDDVARTLLTLRSPHVVRLFEYGTTPDGRAFELMELVPDGSLRGTGAGSRAFGVGPVTAVTRQLTEGLTALHAKGITHRDLKPENVLVRGSGRETTFVLTDFGVSRVLAATAHFTGQAMTDSYAAPESWSGHVSPARDWWSLGMIVRELATGETPYRGLDPRVIQMAVTTKVVPVDDVPDPRVRMLCAGLLVADVATRWGVDEVRAWLAGGSPPVPDRRMQADVAAFPFGSVNHVDPAALAVALAGDWRLAADRFPGPRQGGGNHWAALKTWLLQFDDPDVMTAAQIEARRDALDELDRSAAGPDEKLVRLLAAINPAMPPVYRGRLVDVATLRALAERVADGDPADPGTTTAGDVLTELWRGRLLLVLARFAGAEELTAVDDRWRSAWQALDVAAREVQARCGHATPAGTADRRRALAAMAELALGVDRGPDRVRAVRRHEADLPVRVAWFTDAVLWAGPDPVRAFAVLRVAARARAEADRVVRDRQAALDAQRAREQAWEAHEVRRLAGRGAAVGTALGGAAVLWGFWTVVTVAASGAAMASALLAVGLAVVTHLTAEVSLASTLGDEYHPRHSLSQWLRVRAGGLGYRMRGRPLLWAIGIVVGLVLLGRAPVLIPLAAVAAAAGHVVWALVRHRAWARVHDDERTRALRP
jgi:serine/threonine protein kinase